jgi:hypothetical protein
MMDWEESCWDCGWGGGTAGFRCRPSIGAWRSCVGVICSKHSAVFVLSHLLLVNFEQIGLNNELEGFWEVSNGKVKFDIT